MSSLQSRLDFVFGGLHSSLEAPAWTPTAEQVFRGGDEPSMEEASSEDGESDEGQERIGREFHAGMGIEFAQEDYVDEDGFLASRAFIGQIDTEAEVDGHDQQAVEYGAEQRPSPRTQVLQGNVYDQRSAFGEALALEEQPGSDAEQLMEEDAGPSSPVSPRPPISLRSSFRRQRSSRIKKRVSFTGVPEPARPWVPPHRRSGFLSKLTTSAQETLGGNKQNSHKGYVRYDLEEPLIIGGGIGQLERANDDGRQALEDTLVAVASTSGASEPQLDEIEVERWQGAVGGGIEFRAPRGKEFSNATMRHASDRTMGSTRMPSLDWEEGDDLGDEDYNADVKGGGERRQRRRQYRQRNLNS